jgi:hypothetical protein
MPPYLDARQVAELAALLDDAPCRIGLVARVLDAAECGRGLDLRTDEIRSLVRQLARRPDDPDRGDVDRIRSEWRRLLRS